MTRSCSTCGDSFDEKDLILISNGHKVFMDTNNERAMECKDCSEKKKLKTPD